MRSFLVRKINNFTKTLSLRAKVPNTYGARLYISNFYTFFLLPEIEIFRVVKMFHHCNAIIAKLCYQNPNKHLCYAELFEIQPREREYLYSVYKCILYNTNVYYIIEMYIMNPGQNATE